MRQDWRAARPVDGVASGAYGMRIDERPRKQPARACMPIPWNTVLAMRVAETVTLIRGEAGRARACARADRVCSATVLWRNRKTRGAVGANPYRRTYRKPFTASRTLTRCSFSSARQVTRNTRESAVYWSPARVQFWLRDLCALECNRSSTPRVKKVRYGCADAPE